MQGAALHTFFFAGLLPFKHFLQGCQHSFFLQGCTLHCSINPNPFFVRRGFRPLPKPLANLWQGA